MFKFLSYGVTIFISEFFNLFFIFMILSLFIVAKNISVILNPPLKSLIFIITLVRNITYITNFSLLYNKRLIITTNYQPYQYPLTINISTPSGAETLILCNVMYKKLLLLQYIFLQHIYTDQHLIIDSYSFLYCFQHSLYYAKTIMIYYYYPFLHFSIILNKIIINHITIPIYCPITDDIATPEIPDAGISKYPNIRALFKSL